MEAGVKWSLRVSPNSLRAKMSLQLPSVYMSWQKASHQLPRI